MSNVLYIRAGLSNIKLKKSEIIKALKSEFKADELMAPAFTGARRVFSAENTIQRNLGGALSKLILNEVDSVVSFHPSHKFCGTKGLKSLLSQHDYNKSCFWPVKMLAEEYDSSMLLIGCLTESPGFSTVHASQEILGLTKLHLLRFLYRWDYNNSSHIAREIPGCSLSFGKFYEHYINKDLLKVGKFAGLNYIYISSIAKAMEIELEILKKNPRFVKCEKKFCLTCSLRLY